jgi:PAS domain S-box-containing protein
MGTNGAGTSLASGAPVAVIARDHWCGAWHEATCLGAPVLGWDGRPVGAIDVSMGVQDGDAERLVVSAHVASTISLGLAHAEAEAALARERATEAALRDSRARLSLALDKAAMGMWELNLTTGQCLWSEQLLQTIIDSTPALVYVVDADGRFRLINRRFAELLSLEPAHVTGRSLADCFPTEAAQFLENNRRVLEVGGACEFEEVVQLGGAHHTFISVKAPLLDGEGVPYAVCGISADITPSASASFPLSREPSGRRSSATAAPSKPAGRARPGKRVRGASARRAGCKRAGGARLRLLTR